MYQYGALPLTGGAWLFVDGRRRSRFFFSDDLIRKQSFLEGKNWIRIRVNSNRIRNPDWLLEK